MDYMVSAGYNPYGMVETMQMLQDRQQSRPVEFLSTHPAPENRMTYLTEKIQTRYYGLEALKVGSEDYRRAVLERLSD
jgi:predicted Zn-dependent protease